MYGKTTLHYGSNPINFDFFILSTSADSRLQPHRVPCIELPYNHTVRDLVHFMPLTGKCTELRSVRGPNWAARLTGHRSNSTGRGTAHITIKFELSRATFPG